jgi:hypothetical protein
MVQTTPFSSTLSSPAHQHIETFFFLLPFTSHIPRHRRPLFRYPRLEASDRFRIPSRSPLPKRLPRFRNSCRLRSGREKRGPLSRLDSLPNGRPFAPAGGLGKEHELEANRQGGQGCRGARVRSSSSRFRDGPGRCRARKISV